MLEHAPRQLRIGAAVQRKLEQQTRLVCPKPTRMAECQTFVVRFPVRGLLDCKGKQLVALSNSSSDAAGIEREPIIANLPDQSSRQRGCSS